MSIKHLKFTFVLFFLVLTFGAIFSNSPKAWAQAGPFIGNKPGPAPNPLILLPPTNLPPIPPYNPNNPLGLPSTNFPVPITLPPVPPAIPGATIPGTVPGTTTPATTVDPNAESGTGVGAKCGEMCRTNKLGFFSPTGVIRDSICQMQCTVISWFASGLTWAFNWMVLPNIM